MTRILAITRTVWLEMIRRKDIYVLLILLVTLLFILMSLNIFGLGGMVRYVTDLGFTLAWLFSWILGINFAARQLPQEEARGTIYPLLAKPLGRGELILGKWLGAWSATAVATTVFYLLIVLIIRLRGGTVVPVPLFQALLLHLAAVGIVTAMAIAVSTRMTYGAAATMSYVIAISSFIIVPQTPQMIVNEQGFTRTALFAIYYALPHFELFDMRQRVVHEWGAVPGPVLGGIILYGLVWVGILLMLAWMGYRKKTFKRGYLG